jgi:HNH endonuclease/NUMOD4 motif
LLHRKFELLKQFTMTNLQEIYLPIKNMGNNYYSVSNFGNIKTNNWRNTKKKAILKPAKCKKGYLRCALICNGKLKSYKVHRVVASAFIKNIDNKPQVNHINGIKHDNHVSNLEWVTNRENVNHSYKLGLQVSKSGNNFHRTKHSDEFVLQIFKEWKNGTPKRELARKYKVDRNIFKRKIICQV